MEFPLAGPRDRTHCITVTATVIMCDADYVTARASKTPAVCVRFPRGDNMRSLTICGDNAPSPCAMIL